MPAGATRKPKCSRLIRAERKKERETLYSCKEKQAQVRARKKENKVCFSKGIKPERGGARSRGTKAKLRRPTEKKGGEIRGLCKNPPGSKNKGGKEGPSELN